jgi:hypothetical protein
MWLERSRKKRYEGEVEEHKKKVTDRKNMKDDTGRA